MKKKTNKSPQKKKSILFIPIGFAIVGVIVFLVFSQNQVNSPPEFSDYLHLENNTNVRSLPDTITDKTILPGHIFGFPIDNGLKNSINLIALSNEQHKVSIRFTASHAGALNKIIVNLRTNMENEIKIGIQEDNDGSPSGKWLGNEPGYIISKINPETKLHGVQLSDGVTLQSGKIYHIVIEPNKIISDRIWMGTYHENWLVNPLNYENPDDTWADPMMNTLFYDGKSWKMQDKWPIFVVEYTNGFSDGQPYSLMAQWVIRDTRIAGQAVRPYSDYKIGSIAFVIDKKGTPKDDFYFTIYDIENNVLEKGIFAKEGEVTNAKQWHTKILNSPVILHKNQFYQVVLSSPGSDLDNYYEVFGHEYMLDPSIGYGSTRHHLTASYDGGKNWIKWYDADAAFKFITVK